MKDQEIRLIDANAIAQKWHYDEFTVGSEDYYDKVVYLEDIENAPTIEAKPVTHAHWNYKHRHRGGFHYRTGPDEWGNMHTIRLDDRWEEDVPYCSNCGKFTEDIPDPEFCPHCGAIMDEVTDHEG